MAQEVKIAILVSLVHTYRSVNQLSHLAGGQNYVENLQPHRLLYATDSQKPNKPKDSFMYHRKNGVLSAMLNNDNCDR